MALRHNLLLWSLIIFFIVGSVGILEPLHYICFLLIVMLVTFGYLFYRGVSVRISKAVILLLGFLIISLGSLFFSVNYQESISIFLLYFLCFGVYLCGYNFQELKLLVGRFIIITSFILCGLSLIVTVFYEIGYKYLDGYQLIFSRFGSHNHLGDYLALTIIYCLFSFIKSKRRQFLWLTLFFLPFFVFSYSRSAYLSLMLGIGLLFLFYIKASFKSVLFFLSCLVVVLGLVFVTTYDLRRFILLHSESDFLADSLGLKYKSLTGGRDDFLNTAYRSFIENPWVGVGPGNFVYASQKYTIRTNKTESSHNIILDILVENGIFALGAFILFLTASLKKAVKDIYLIMAVALFVNFMFDYTFKITVILLLFFTLFGMVDHEDRNN